MDTNTLKCLKNTDTHAYVIPTDKWLTPIKPLISSSSNAQKIIARMLQKEKILVRVTNNNNKRLSIINKNLSGLPNFPIVYCTIICQESSDILDVDYMIADKPVRGFCNGKSTDTFVTLELMKYYKENVINSLLESKIKLEELKQLLNQTLSAQLIAFQLFGFLHNDIHLDNFIIIQDHFEYTYTFDKRVGFSDVKVINGVKVIIIDFGVSEMMDSKYRSKYIDDYFVKKFDQLLPNRKYFNKENTLPNNLFETIKTLLSLVDNSKSLVDKIRNIIIENNQLLDYYNYHYNKRQHSFFSTNDFDIFMRKVLDLSIRMINDIYNVLFGCDFSII